MRPRGWSFGQKLNSTAESVGKTGAPGPGAYQNNGNNESRILQGKFGRESRFSWIKNQGEDGQEASFYNISTDIFRKDSSLVPTFGTSERPQIITWKVDPGPGEYDITVGSDSGPKWHIAERSRGIQINHSELPGPASYDLEYNSLQHALIRPRFGLAMSRRDNSVKQSDRRVGPGSYDVTIKSSELSGITIGERFEDRQSARVTSGPGSYIIPGSIGKVPQYMGTEAIAATRAYQAGNAVRSAEIAAMKAQEALKAAEAAKAAVTEKREQCQAIAAQAFEANAINEEKAFEAAQATEVVAAAAKKQAKGIQKARKVVASSKPSRASELQESADIEKAERAATAKEAALYATAIAREARKTAQEATYATRIDAAKASAKATKAEKEAKSEARQAAIDAKQGELVEAEDVQVETKAAAAKASRLAKEKTGAAARASIAARAAETHAIQAAKAVILAQAAAAKASQIAVDKSFLAVRSAAITSVATPQTKKESAQIPRSGVGNSISSINALEQAQYT